MSIYADSSFFVAVYLRDHHTAEALARLIQRPRIWFTPLHQVELTHAVAQYVFRRELSPSRADQTYQALEEDCDAALWQQIDLPSAIFETAVSLARIHVPHTGTRTLDTLHVAAALELGAKEFWTFDERQAKLAKAAGLKVT